MRRSSLVIFSVFFLFACQKFVLPDRNQDSSKHNEEESHNKGQNCMTCHYSAGWAEGVFTVAGSLYGNTDNANVELYRDINEAPIKTIEVDLLGNIYTPDDVDFSNGLHVGVRNQQGDIEFMEDKIFNGQCNLCHGTSTQEKIQIN